MLRELIDKHSSQYFFGMVDSSVDSRFSMFFPLAILQCIAIQHSVIIDKKVTGSKLILQLVSNLLLPVPGCNGD